MQETSLQIRGESGLYFQKLHVHCSFKIHQYETNVTFSFTFCFPSWSAYEPSLIGLVLTLPYFTFSDHAHVNRHNKSRLMIEEIN